MRVLKSSKQAAEILSNGQFVIRVPRGEFVTGDTVTIYRKGILNGNAVLGARVESSGLPVKEGRTAVEYFAPSARWM